MRSILVAAGAAVLLVVLAGCDEPPPHVTPVPTPSVTAVFASDEEALAAAEESYRAYLAVSDQILHEGGTNSDRISPYVTSSELANTLEGFSKIQMASLHTQGATHFDNMTLERYGPSDVDVYVCLDVAEVRVLDASGADVTPTERVDRLPLELGFVAYGSSILVDRSDSWTGDDFC